MKKLRSGGFMISKIHLLAGRIFNQKLKAFNMTELEAGPGRILFALWEEDKISIRRLSEKTLLEMSTLTSMLDRLEMKGYLNRIPSKDDRRVIIIQRTQKDKEFQKVFLKISNEMIEHFYRGFSEKEIELFERFLERILNNLMN